ncbi:ABC transporter ATP-binding protein [Halomicrococcus sp. NG-SE-24]|uniref:ABC transporter ATP-binding protein n=1 Tax=Halomicrococcus sp. NG-SE-24 TaxID=3436928 RepID=UPI003D97F80C
MTLLATDNLQKEFGGVRALDGVSLDIDQGELVGIIGPNGAGKTTLFNCVSGVEEPTAGTVHLNGDNITNKSTDTIAQKGLVRTFQLTRELQTMTVRENVMLAAPDQPGEHTIPALLHNEEMQSREREVRQQADELINQFELDHLATEYSGNLSGGQRKLLELARALMLDPAILMLDEPFAGVNPTLTRKLTNHIKSLNENGQTVIVIEHELETLTELVDRLIVLQQGKLLVEGDPDEVVEDERVIEAYLGGDIE